ncbi:YetF domain-containing protein [Enterococcus faecalis]|uniref:YetF domain-containing protein n=1 Tax=Enterococcus faecalis TaxID=1351 RepID=UPI003CC53C8F
MVENGKLLHQRLRDARLVEADVMEAARSSQGIEKLEEIKLAIIERNGKISIIARED